jgi:hypothetical protein
MKKKIYDFSPFNAVVAILAYGFMITLGFFFVFDFEGVNWIGIVFTSLLIISFGMILWYFVFLAVTVTDKGIRHGKKFIQKKNVRMTVEYNSRFRQREIIFRDHTVNYEKLTKNEISRQQIVVQYFPRHQPFLDEYLGKPPVKEVTPDEKQKPD